MARLHLDGLSLLGPRLVSLIESLTISAPTLSISTAISLDLRIMRLLPVDPGPSLTHLPRPPVLDLAHSYSRRVMT